MSRSGNNIILYFLIKIREECQITCYSYYKPSVLFGILLRLSQCCIINDIYLYVFSVVFKEGLYNAFDGVCASFALYSR